MRAPSGNLIVGPLLNVPSNSGTVERSHSVHPESQEDHAGAVAISYSRLRDFDAIHHQVRHRTGTTPVGGVVPRTDGPEHHQRMILPARYPKYCVDGLFLVPLGR